MTNPDPQRYVPAGLNADTNQEVYVPRTVVREDGTVEMRHPNLPDQPIHVKAALVAARLRAGWVPVEPEPEPGPEIAEGEPAPDQEQLDESLPEAAPEKSEE